MKILIWGTGRLALRYIRYEYFADNEIIGFVDSYKKSETFMGFPIFKPNQISTLEYEYLVICVLNKNSEILKTCISEKIDLRNVLFVDNVTSYESIEKNHLNQLLNIDQLKDIFPIIYKDIKEREKQYQYINDKSILKEELSDNAFIRKLSKYHVVVWIPIELLFSEKKEDVFLEEYTEEWIQQNSKLENIPIISFEPYRNLYEFFLEGKEYPYVYCEWYQKLFISRGLQSGVTNEQLIEKRLREFKIMQQELNKGMSFFIDHPAIAKWNDKGYFNLLDGHHRTAFLYHSGLAKVPIQITHKDYENWCNKSLANMVHQIILKQKRTEFYQPILNPYFLRLHPHREDSVKSRLHHLLEFFGNHRFIGKKIIDIGANLGFIGQAFCRMGAEVTLLEPDVIHYELTQAINRLLRTECKIVTQKFEEYETDENYDIAILLTVFYHYFDNLVIRDKFVQHLNKNVSSMIVWESGKSPEEEKKYIVEHTKFCKYKHLCYTYATGKFRELGIFAVAGSEYQ